MMKKIAAFSAIILIYALSAAAFDFSSVSSDTKRVEFESGFARYDQQKGEIYLSTQVTVRQINDEDILLKKIMSDQMLVKTSESLILMDSPFEMHDSTGIIKAGRGYYDYSKNEGEIKNGVFNMGRFILRGRQIKVRDGSYSYRKASVTTCDLPDPHYRIGAYKITLVPGRYFIAYSTVFYLGKIPVFYFPVVYKPLGEGTPVLSQFYPGYDERNGFYIKSNYIYKFNRYTRLKAFLDYFSRRGLGTGTEADYYKPDKNITSLSFYRIKEYGDKSERWGLNGGIWHSFKNEKHDAYLQTYARLLSDPGFNNDFFRSNPFAVTSDKQAGAAFTYNARKTNTRLSYYTRYVSTDSDTSFYHAYETAPRLDFQTVPMRVMGSPFLNSWNFYAENVKDATPYYQSRLYGAWNVSMPVKIYKTFNFYPEAFYYQNLYFSTSSHNSDEWIGRYGTKLNLRKSNDWGSLDLTFYSLRRNRPNKTELDRKAPDEGVENQELNFSAFWIRSSNSYMRFSSGYDFKNYKVEPGFRKRIFPLTVETYFSAAGREIFLQDSYDLDKGNKSFISQLNLGGEKEYFNFGLANYSSDRSKWIVSNGIGMVPPIPGRWRTELTLRYFVDSADGRLKTSFFEKSAVIYKDFHDFRTRFNIRVRRGVKEFFVYLTLKMNDSYRNDEMSQKADYFWRPWRKPGEPRD